MKTAVEKKPARPLSARRDRGSSRPPRKRRILVVVLAALLGPALLAGGVLAYLGANGLLAVAAGSTRISSQDGMILVYVPKGQFTMGSAVDNSDGRIAHTVYLDGFWIDQTEVTNAMYAECAAAGICRPPGDASSETRSSYHGSPQYADFPVIYVSWDDARTYCEWAGRRLPTEAEWEKAVRGRDGRLYPWGNTIPAANTLNYRLDVGDTSQVGSYPSGASPYGTLDMAGNVWEWVADWFDPDYYLQSPAENPQGPASGEARVLRGGSWRDGLVNSASRFHQPPDGRYFDSGFRCASSTRP